MEREDESLRTGMTSDERIADQEEGSTGGSGYDSPEEAAKDEDESPPQPGAGQS